MKISLYRHQGYLQNCYGRALPLSFFFNEIKVGTIQTGETKIITLPNVSGIFQVGFTKADQGFDLPNSEASKQSSNCLATSHKYPIDLTSEGGSFETGTKEWVLFDFIGFTYVPFFARTSLFLREI